MSKKPFLARYTLDELIAITDEWEAWAEYKDRHNIHVRLMDTMDAIHKLSPPLAEAVFLIGLAQLPTREAAKFAGVPYVTLWRRYQRGLENMAHYLNGETYTK
jgi:DNA-directed RNA polymerase specialized sigma24 family protein